MIGIIYYLYFLILGFFYSKYIFNKNIYFHLWIGGVLGNVILMFGMMIISLVLGFTITSHLIFLILSTIPLLLLFKFKGLPKSFKKDKNEEMTNKIFWFIIIPIFILIAVLLTNHILVPVEEGYASGQSTYGDLNMHLGFITSIKEQQTFPPDYVFLSGEKLNYPFLVNMLSSSVYSFGTSLRMSVLIPSYVMCLLLIMGFYYLAHKITNNKKAAAIATIFFFIGGGLGFAYFFDGARGNVENYTRIFTDYYHTPTNFNENNIRWANPICDMIIPQRTTMAGWLVLLPCLWLLIDACKTNKRKSFIILGLLASTLPMIHTHSFFALGVICIGMFFFYFFSNNNKKEIFNNWFIFGLIVLLIGFPQLFLWTFQQTSGNSSFIRFQFNWVNKVDPYIWFYLKNWGLIVIFIIPAFLNSNKDNKKLLLSALLLFIVAELFLFQPNEYDNNKLFFVVYMIFLIICCDWYVYIFDKLKKEKGITFLAIVLIVVSTMSGILTIGRELKSGGEFTTFTNDMIEMADYIKDNTNSKSIFLTSTSHINPVTSLAGRTTYVGPAIYVYFHGFTDEFMERNSKISRIYSSEYDELYEFCKQNNIEYVYVGSYEASMYNVNWDTISKLECVATFGIERLYKVV